MRLWVGVVREGFLDWELLAGRSYDFYLGISIPGLLPGIQQVFNKCILNKWIEEREELGLSVESRIVRYLGEGPFRQGMG